MNQMKEKQRDYKAGDLRSADMKNKKPEWGTKLCLKVGVIKRNQT